MAHGARRMVRGAARPPNRSQAPVSNYPARRHSPPGQSRHVCRETRLPFMTRPTLSILTDATCGDACWHAREEVCRCSCGGRNHGILRGTGGTQPARTARIDGHVFTLRAVGSHSDLAPETRRIHRLAYASKRYGWMQKTPDFPAVLRAASAAQIAGWKELAAYHSGSAGRVSPYLLWIQVEELAALESATKTSPEIAAPVPQFPDPAADIESWAATLTEADHQRIAPRHHAVMAAL